MNNSTISWQIAGYAGEGIMKTGEMFSKIALRHGFQTFDYTEYPSLIRGGHNVYQVVYGPEPVYAQSSRVDLMVAMNADGLKLHAHEFTDATIVLYDAQDDDIAIESYDLKGSAIDVPMVALARSVGSERLAANMVGLGASVYICSLDLSILDTLIEDAFGHKSPEIVKLNRAAAQAGYEYAQKLGKTLEHLPQRPEIMKGVVSLTGNQAISLGALAGGMKAYFAYPMTPSSSILHTLASWSTDADVLVKHAEDEIGVINMSLGASFAGVRAAVGTSGGGFCYMSEAVGFSGIAELPLVIYESQRPGPAVGMPTWTGQGDLLFSLFVSQDEFPRIVLAPGDVQEAFELSRLAFDLADEYQLPVIVLSDKHLSESSQSTVFQQTSFEVELKSREENPSLDDNGMFPRYRATESGVTPRTIPGQINGFYVSNSYETDDYGFASEEASVRVTQMDKRMRKLVQIRKQIPKQFFEGSEDAVLTFVGFGSTKNVMRAARQQLASEGINVSIFNLSWMWPFPAAQVIEVLRDAINVVVVEGNSTNQLATLIRSQTGIDIYHKRGRYDGRPFYVDDLVGFAHEILER